MIVKLLGGAVTHYAREGRTMCGLRRGVPDQGEPQGTRIGCKRCRRNTAIKLMIARGTLT